MNQDTASDLQLVYWALTGWEDLRQRPQHLAAALAQRNTVLYIRPVPLSRLRHGRPLPPAVEHLSDRLCLLRPRALSPGRLRAVARLNDARAAAMVRRHLDPGRPVVLWLGHPDQAGQIGRCGEALVVFDSMDYHAAFKQGAAAARMAAAELSLLRRADLVLTSSADLQARAEAAGARAVPVPNAAEFEHFAAAATRPLAAPTEIAGLPRPRLLFYGTLGPWLDTGLLAAIARSRPDWTLLVMGPPAGANLALLAGRPNVHLLGWRPYETLPAYLQHADACLLPFVADALTRAVDPVKLYEYLAAGKPVIATPLPELDKCGDLIDVVTTPAAAVAAVERHLLAPDDSERRWRRLAFAAEHTWEQRAAAAVAAIKAALRRNHT